MTDASTERPLMLYFQWQASDTRGTDTKLGDRLICDTHI